MGMETKRPADRSLVLSAILYRGVLRFHSHRSRESLPAAYRRSALRPASHVQRPETRDSQAIVIRNDLADAMRKLQKSGREARIGHEIGDVANVAPSEALVQRVN